eukprot:700527-Amorphochlora_amoeboformis.AAC.1
MEYRNLENSHSDGYSNSEERTTQPCPMGNPEEGGKDEGAGEHRGTGLSPKRGWLRLRAKF